MSLDRSQEPAQAARLAALLWNRAIPEPNSGCWLWLGHLNNRGYPDLRNRIVSLPLPTRAGHRLSYEAHRGPIPAGLWVLHKCDVRSCINPDHLFIGNNSDNVMDRNRKGRSGQRCGSQMRNAKLNEQAVLAIRGAREPIAG